MKELLNRHISLSKTEESQNKEQFICNKLHVPVQWLHEAKVRRYMNCV